MERQNATGIAAGITLAVVGGVTALVLTTGPSIAAALEGDNTEVVTEMETDPMAEPTVYIVDENGNLVSADDPSAPTESAPASEGEEHDEYEEDEHEEEYESGEYEEDEDEYEYEEDEDEYEAHGASSNG